MPLYSGKQSHQAYKKKCLKISFTFTYLVYTVVWQDVMSVNVVWMCEGYGEFSSFFLVFLCLFAGFSRDCCWFLAKFSLWHCHSGSYLNRAFTWQLNRAFSSQLNRAFSYNNNHPLIYTTNLRDNSAQPLGAWASRPRLTYKVIKSLIQQLQLLNII